VKVLLPGYRQRIRHKHLALLDLIRTVMPHLAFGQDGDVPWLSASDRNIRLYGFATEPSNAELYDIVGSALPQNLPREYFRLVKDYVTRWLYPHMRPDLSVGPYGIDQLNGLHGQHKDNIHHIEDPAARDRLMRAFQPGAQDVVIDCGAFLGFGAIRMARDAPAGRVVAVEASGECFGLLTRNIEENAIRNVFPLHSGIWSEEGDLSLEKTYAQGNSLVAEVQKGVECETVRTVTIDGIVDRFKLDRLDMVSLTLNGAEVEALQGAEIALSRMRPRIRAAGWYSRGGRHIADILRPVLERHGYDVFVGPRKNVMALPRERN
jgi:FkbM family methyltransferase